MLREGERKRRRSRPTSCRTALPLLPGDFAVLTYYFNFMDVWNAVGPHLTEMPSHNLRFICRRGLGLF